MITRVDLGAGVGAAFTGRTGGVSVRPYDALNLGGAVGDDPAAVAQNRIRAAAALGVDPHRIAWMRQVHGAEVAVAGDGAARLAGQAGPAGQIGSAGPGDPPAVDGIVTAEPGLALGVLVADCAPVLLADPVARVIGAAHSGRPGTEAGVVPAVLERMCVLGAEPSRVTAAIGPMVCGGCYEVPAALRDQVTAAVPAARATTRGGTPALDLGAGIVAQLEAAGVGRIRRDPRCTMETPGFFSYRRDGRTGRFAGFVWIEGDL